MPRCHGRPGRISTALGTKLARVCVTHGNLPLWDSTMVDRKVLRLLLAAARSTDDALMRDRVGRIEPTVQHALGE